MADDDWGFTFETPTAKAWDQQQEDDVADDWDVDEDQVQPQSSAAKSEPEPAAAAVPAKGKADTKDDKAGQQKMTKLAKQRQEQMLAMQKAKAEQAEREREAAARRARLEEEERQRRKDPNYLAQVKQREREDMERAERELIDDFLGGGEPASKTRESEQKTIPSRAAELAATTGLGDGADIPQGAGLGIPADKSGDVSAPNALDAVSLATKEEVASFAKTLADKMNAIKNSANSLELLRVLSQQIGPALKFDDLSEFLRIVTVIKNEAQKAQQNKKKATKGKAVIKGLGSQYDDYTGSQYDDMF